MKEPTFAFLGHTAPLGRFVATGCISVARFECVARIARDVHNTAVDLLSRVDGCFVECREPRTANNWTWKTVTFNEVFFSSICRNRNQGISNIVIVT